MPLPDFVRSELDLLEIPVNRIVHGYGHMLDEAKLRELAVPIAETFHLFKCHIEADKTSSRASRPLEE